VQLRVRSPPTPTRQLLVVTGFNMGWAGLDARVLGLRWWLNRGYRVAVLGLPLHGTRGPGLGPPAWPSADLDLTRDALAAATQDVREAVAYLRAEAPLPVVALGVSLGAWPVALAGTTAGPPDGLAALTPMVDYAALLQAHAPPWVFSNVVRRIGEVLRPLSPLERPPTMAPGRTLVLAAESDHVAPARDHAEPLAAHFRGTVVRFPGSHLVPWGLKRAWEALEALPLDA
jgi:dienelactone hydrolase